MPPSSTPSPPPFFALPSTIRNLLNTSAPLPSPASRAHILNLPLEIRQIIYTYVLDDEPDYPTPIPTDRTPEEDEGDHECDIRGPYILPRVRGSTLLRVNRQIHGETREFQAKERRRRKRDPKQQQRSNDDDDGDRSRTTAYKCEITLKNEAYFYPVWTRIPSFLPFQLQSSLPSPSTTPSPSTEERTPLGTLPALNLTLHIRGDNQQRTLPHRLVGPFYANGLDPPSPVWSLWCIIKRILTRGPPLNSGKDARSNGVRVGSLTLNVLTPPPSALADGLGILPVEGFRELRGFRRAGVINPRTVAGEFVAYTEWLWGEGGYPDGDHLGVLFVERLDVFSVCVDGVAVKEWDVKGIRGRGRKQLGQT